MDAICGSVHYETKHNIRILYKFLKGIRIFKKLMVRIRKTILDHFSTSLNDFSTSLDDFSTSLDY